MLVLLLFILKFLAYQFCSTAEVLCIGICNKLSTSKRTLCVQDQSQLVLLSMRISCLPFMKIRCLSLERGAFCDSV